MDELFKQKLLTLRNPPKARTFGEALLGPVNWGKKIVRTVVKVIPQEIYSEKIQVIESLERFAQAESEILKSSVIKIEGGELHLKPDPGWDETTEFTSINTLLDSLTIDKRTLDVVLKHKSKESVQVIFVTEKFRTWEDLSTDLKTGFINELITSLPLKTAELFERMIVAMKLTPEEVLIYPIEDQERDLTQEVLNIVAFMKPQVVISLGAKATLKILKNPDRLSILHGQFFKRSLEGVGDFQVVPLFHPSIIENNQNMKKTAWADMQKIMKYLKKLS